MKPSHFLLLSSVAIPVLFGGASMAFAEQSHSQNVIVIAQAEDRVQKARELLEQAQNSLKQAEETGGDVRAARRGVAEAMKKLRAAESAGGGVSAPAEPRKPAAQQPARGDDKAAPAQPSAGDGSQPKPYQPPAGAKKPVEPSAKPAPERKPTPAGQGEAKPKPPRTQPSQGQPPKGQPDKAQTAPDRRPSETGNRPTRSERPRPDARPPRPGDRNEGSYRDDYRDGPPRDIFVDGPRPGDREVAPPAGYRDDRRSYRPNDRFIDGGRATERQIEDTFRSAPVQRIDRGYSMNEIRRDPRVRDMVRRVDLDSITFEFGSARVPDDQVRKLRSIGRAMGRVIDRNPGAVFLIEGHTDAVGTDLANLELSDRRAAAVAGILSDYFDIPRRSLVSEGYGERYLKIPTDGPERQNRRVTIRNITPLLGR